MIKAGGRVQLYRKTSPNPKIGQQEGPPQDIRKLTYPDSETHEIAKRPREIAGVKDIRCVKLKVKPIAKTTNTTFAN